MIQSMWTGVSGLRTHQQKMDVIGNDIANVNTVAYKESDANFKEQLVETIRRPQASLPGIQVGLGVMMGGISRNFKDGVLMETQRSTNLAVSGDGFFSVRQGTQTYFTRAGDFDLQYDGTGGGGGSTYLINPDGYRLQDATGADVTLPPTTVSFAVNADGTLTAYDNTGATVYTATIALTSFANPNGLMAVGHNMYQSDDAVSGRRAARADGDIYQGFLETSNVDLADEFTEMIMTQRGFQANSRCITTGDEMLQEILTLKR